MLKRALFFSNQGLSTLHLGIELEVIERISPEYNQVFYSTCNSKTKSCFFNPTGNPVGCAICQSRNEKFHKLLPLANLKHIPFPAVEVNTLAKSIANQSNINIEDWSYEKINIGRGILSSVISLKRDYEVFTENIKPLILEELKVALKALLGFKELVSKVKPDVVYIFNGRFSETFPIVSYCKFYNIPFSTMEVGATNQKFEIFDNHLPHSIIARQNNMWNLWNNATETKYQIAENWFLEKVLGQHKDDKNYTDRQKKSLLPDSFDFLKYNISIFNSSEDEMKVIEEWQHGIYNTQNEAIKRIVSFFQHNDGIHFYLRMHPNLSNLLNTQVKEIYEFNFSNLTIIPASDPVDTYALMENSNMVISFGSTVGIEATYMERVSVILGKSFYSMMDAVYEPKSFDELFELINNNENLKAKPKINTLPYAFYVSTRGQDYLNFSYKNKFESYYRNIRMKNFYGSTILQAFKYSLNIQFYIKKFSILYNRFPGIKDVKKLKI